MKTTSPPPREVWQQLLEADPTALVSQTPAWVDCMCATGAYQEASRLYEFTNGQQLVLPLVRRKKTPSALALQASPPYGWGIGGLVSRRPVQAEELTAVFTDLAQQPYLQTTIRPNPVLGETWAAAAPSHVIAKPRLAHALDLSGGFQVVWKERFSSSTRRNVRKAEQAGVVVECDTSGKLMPVFYDLLRQSFERWAEKQHEPRWLAYWRGQRRDPLSKFQLMAKFLGNACRLWVAWFEEKAVAAILVLQGANAYYTRGAMNETLAGPTRANYLLHKLAIEAACQAGCHYYHMGETGSASSLAYFKSRFGAEPYPYAEYRLERLPLTQVDKQLRGIVKWTIGFKDA